MAATVVGSITGKLVLDKKSFDTSLKKALKDATNFKKEIAKSVKTPSINVNVKQALASIKQVSNALAKLPSNKKITITTSQSTRASVTQATSSATRVTRDRSGESATSRRAPFNIDRNLVDISTKPLLKFLAGGELIQAFKQIAREAIKGSAVLSKAFDKIFQSSVSIVRSFGELLLKTPIIGDVFKAFTNGLSNVAKFLDNWNKQGLVQATKESPTTAIGLGAGAITLATLLAPILADNLTKIKTAIKVYIASIKMAVNAGFEKAFTKGSFTLLSAEGMGFTFFDKLKVILPVLITKLGAFLAPLASLASVTVVVALALKTIADSFSLWSEVNEMFGQNTSLFEDMALGLDGLFGGITFFTDTLNKMGNLWDGFLDGVDDFFAGVALTYNTIIDKLAKFITPDFSAEIERLAMPISSATRTKGQQDKRSKIAEDKEAINRERSRLTAQFSRTTPEGLQRIQSEALAQLTAGNFKSPLDKIFAELAASISGGELLLRATVSEFDKNIIDSIRSGNKELSAESLKSLSTDAARLEAIKAFEGGGIDMESILKTFTNGLLRFNAEQIIKKKNLSPEDQFNRGITIAEQEQMERDKKIPTIRSIAKDIGLEELQRRLAMSNVARKLGLPINPASQINPELAPQAKFGSVEAFKIINERTSTEDKIQRNTERTASVLEKLLSNGLTLKDIAVAN